MPVDYRQAENIEPDYKRIVPPPAADTDLDRNVDILLTDSVYEWEDSLVNYMRAEVIATSSGSHSRTVAAAAGSVHSCSCHHLHRSSVYVVAIADHCWRSCMNSLGTVQSSCLSNRTGR